MNEIDIAAMRKLHSQRNDSTDARILWDTETRNKVLPLMDEVEALRSRIARLEGALQGALVLANCYAETKDDPEAWKWNNDNYCRITDALRAALQPPQTSPELEDIRFTCPECSSWLGNFVREVDGKAICISCKHLWNPPQTEGEKGELNHKSYACEICPWTGFRSQTGTRNGSICCPVCTGWLKPIESTPPQQKPETVNCRCLACGRIHFWSERAVGPVGGHTYCPTPSCSHSQYEKVSPPALTANEGGEG